MICTVAPGQRKGKRPRDWKEMRLAAAPAQGKEETNYAATFGGVDEVGRRWGHCARRAGWGLNSQIHALGDGAEWIRLQTKEVCGRQGVAASRLPIGGVEPDRRASSVALQKRSLPPWPDIWNPRPRRTQRPPVRNGHRYLTHRIDGLDYPRALKLGFPIGSGMMESGHRHVLQARLKKAGAAWLMEHADRIANLRVLRASGQWLSLWN